MATTHLTRETFVGWVRARPRAENVGPIRMGTSTVHEGKTGLKIDILILYLK